MTLAIVVLGAVFSTTHLIVWLIIGLLAGFLATRVVRGPHFGIIGDIVIGLVGAFLAGLVLRILLPDTTLGFVGEIIAAFIGAVILLGSCASLQGRRAVHRRSGLFLVLS